MLRYDLTHFICVIYLLIPDIPLLDSSSSCKYSLNLQSDCNALPHLTLTFYVLETPFMPPAKADELLTLKKFSIYSIF
jgi:hypothetical protein